MSVYAFLVYLGTFLLVSGLATAHLLRTQAQVIRVLQRDHPDAWERYGRPRPYARGLSKMPSYFEWRHHREFGNSEMDRHCAVLRRSLVVNLSLPVLCIAGMYLLVA